MTPKSGHTSLPRRISGGRGPFNTNNTKPTVNIPTVNIPTVNMPTVNKKQTKRHTLGTPFAQAHWRINMNTNIKRK